MNHLILYTAIDGKTRLNLRAEGDSIWLTQLEIAELFQTTKHNISIHTKNIFKEGELVPEATVKESLTVQNEGEREVKRTLTYYNLEQADLRVKQKQDLTLNFWRDNVDRMLVFNDQAVLKGTGSVSHDLMQRVAHERYDVFDQNRRFAEAIEADSDDLREIERLEQQIRQSKG